MNDLIVSPGYGHDQTLTSLDHLKVDRKYYFQICYKLEQFLFGHVCSLSIFFE